MRWAAALLATAALAGCGSGEVGPACRVADGPSYVPGGETLLGSDRFGPEERPVRLVRVAPFWIDRHEVTNDQFGRFVAATGYRTRAERVAGSAAVLDPERSADGWWALRPGATWRAPRGPGSSIEGRGRHPVVQVAFQDAAAYARWAGGELPTEAQWERAARGGLSGASYAWGDEPRPNGRIMVNHHQGAFPVHDSGEDGHAGVAPVGCFPASGYGLHDMAGNVWEWTADRWSVDGVLQAGARVVKGGSFLCSDGYCQRYRPGARQPGADDLATEHTGFRLVWSTPPREGQEG